MNLLGDEEDNHAESRLTINKRFAQKYESRERTKELARAKELLAEAEDDEESDSESEDDDGELVSAEMDIQIVKTINMIRKKDPKIYDREAMWFNKQMEDDDDDDDDEDDNEEDGNKSKSKAKPKSKSKKAYKDVLREQLLEHGADLEEGNDGGSKHIMDPKDRKTLAYDAEQEEIRRNFLKTMNEDDDEDDDDDDVIQLKPKSDADRARDEAELKAALKEMQVLGTKEKKEETEKRDAFLLDYISQQKWKSDQFKDVGHYGKGDHDDDDNNDDNESYEEEENELDNVDLFESKYNFRFEELQGRSHNENDGDERNEGLRAVQVTGHARNVDNSVRRVDEKRKTQREDRKERKEKERRQKESELRRLKILKKQELQSRLAKISDIGGLKDGMEIDESLLEEDWDPVKYEAMMQAQFGSDYYGQEEEDEAFVGHPETGEVELDELGGDDGEEYDAGEEAEEAYHRGDNDENDDDEEEETTNIHIIQKNKKKDKIAKGKGKGATNLTTDTHHSDMMDELYQLDYEDIVAGMPTRFKYRQVEKEDFGLTAEEILLADDSELNQFVSLKKIAAYRVQGIGDGGGEMHKVAKKRKRLRAVLKERLQKEAEEAIAAGKQLKGGVGDMGSQGKKSSSGALMAVEDHDVEDETADAIGDEGGKKKRRRRKKTESSSSSSSSSSSAHTVKRSEVVEEVDHEEVGGDDDAAAAGTVHYEKNHSIHHQSKHHKKDKDHVKNNNSNNKSNNKSKNSNIKHKKNGQSKDKDMLDPKQRRMNLYD